MCHFACCCCCCPLPCQLRFLLGWLTSALNYTYLVRSSDESRRNKEASSYQASCPICGKRPKLAREMGFRKFVPEKYSYNIYLGSLWTSSFKACRDGIHIWFYHMHYARIVTPKIYILLLILFLHVDLVIFFYSTRWKHFTWVVSKDVKIACASLYRYEYIMSCYESNRVHSISYWDFLAPYPSTLSSILNLPILIV